MVVKPIRKSRGPAGLEDVSFVQSKEWFDQHIRREVAGKLYLYILHCHVQN